MRVESPSARREWLTRAGFLIAAFGSGFGANVASAADPLFDATLLADVLRSLGGTPDATTAIDLQLPALSENGAMVPVSVVSRVPRTDQIVLLIEANPFPLVARFDIAPDTEPFVSTRVKVAQSGAVCAAVRADGRWYSTSRNTTVMVGGCGG